MRALFVGVAALVLGGFPTSVAEGQTQQALERARRAAHLPFVRAATNCIANAVLGHPAALDAFRSNTVGRLIGNGIEQCGPQLRRMADEHDRLYGAGTGFRFTTGPFHDGLDRTVTARVRPELARRARAAQTTAAQPTSDRRAQMARLEQTRSALRARMYACTDRELARLARSNEPATVLTEAAMTICQREVHLAIEASFEAWRAQGEVPANARQQLRDLVRQYVTAAAVRLRAELASAPTQQQDAAAGPPARRPAASGGAPAAAGNPERQAVLQCINTVRSALRSNQLQDVEQVRRSVANLCRPEIESLGRAIFLANPSRPLDEGRSEAMVFAQEAIQRAQ